MAMDDKRIKIYEEEGKCEVKVTEEVISIIAKLAALEVDGVESIGGNASGDLATKLGWKNASSGVSISMNQDMISVSVSLIIKLGVNIPEISKKVQEKIKNAIENMTGLSVEAVDVKVANVKIDN